VPVITEKFKRLDQVAPSRSAVGSVFFTVNERRYVTDEDFVVEPVRVQYDLVGGVLTTADLVAGPAVVQIGFSGPTYTINIPEAPGPIRLWPLIDAGLPTPSNEPGLVRNAGGIARIAKITTAQLQAGGGTDPETLFIEFPN